MKNTIKITALAFSLLIPSIASASVIPALTIDFRDAAWADASGKNPFTVGAVTAKAITNKDKVGSTLYQDSKDGLGIKDSACGYEDDEIDTCEKLKVSIAADSYLVSDVWITDLFAARDGGNPKGEKGKLKFNTYSDSTWNTITFWGEDSELGGGPGTNGEQKIALGGNFDVKDIIFWVPKPKDTSEFSVAGLVASSVPEPTPLVLMGLAIFGLGALRRK